MTVYIILFFMIFIGSVLPLSNSKVKKAYCIAVTAAMIIICGLRSKYIGPKNDWGATDTANVHLQSFANISISTWKEIFSNWLRGNSNFRDIGSCAFFKLISYISQSEQVFIFISCIPFFAVIGRFIYKYSNNPVMSFIMVLGLNYFSGSFYLVRHMLAVSAVIVSFDFLYRRDLKKYLIAVVIASLFHATALVMLVVYPFAQIKMSKIHIAVVLGSLIIGLNGKTLWNQIMLFLLGNNSRWLKYIDRGGEFGQTWFIGFAILIFVMLRKKHLYDMYDDKEHSCMISANFNLLTLGCVFYGLMALLIETLRIAMFFMPSAFILVPYAIKSIKSKQTCFAINTVIYLSIIIYFLFFLAKNIDVVPYKFFWQI